MAEIRIRDGRREVVVGGSASIEQLVEGALRAWRGSGLAVVTGGEPREPIGFVLQQTPPITELAEER